MSNKYLEGSVVRQLVMENALDYEDAVYLHNNQTLNTGAGKKEEGRASQMGLMAGETDDRCGMAGLWACLCCCCYRSGYCHRRCWIPTKYRLYQSFHTITFCCALVMFALSICVILWIMCFLGPLLPSWMACPFPSKYQCMGVDVGSDESCAVEDYLQNADWMKDMAEDYPAFLNQKLTSLTLPGTHDSHAYDLSDTLSAAMQDAAIEAVSATDDDALSYSESATKQMEAYAMQEIAEGDGVWDAVGLIKAWATTQRLNIKQQLELGARKLHLYTQREDDGSYVTQHFLVGPTLEEVFEQVKDFAEEHDKEVVFVQIQHRADQKAYQGVASEIESELSTILGGLGYYITDASESTGYDQTVQELIDNGTRVVVSIHVKGEYEPLGKYGFMTGRDLIMQTNQLLTDFGDDEPNYMTVLNWTNTPSAAVIKDVSQMYWIDYFALSSSDVIGMVSLRQVARHVNDLLPGFIADTKDSIAENAGLHTSVGVDFIEESAVVDYALMLNRLMLAELEQNTDLIAKANVLDKSQRWLGESCAKAADCDSAIGLACNHDEDDAVNTICVLETARGTGKLCSADHQCTTGYCNPYSHTCADTKVLSSTSYVKFVLLFWWTVAICSLLYACWIIMRGCVPEMLRYWCYCWWRHVDDLTEQAIRKRTFVTWLDLIICFVSLVGTASAYLSYRAQLRDSESIRLLMVSAGFMILPPILACLAKPLKRKRHMCRQGTAHFMLLLGCVLLYISTPLALNDASWLPEGLAPKGTDPELTPNGRAWPNFQRWWECCGMQTPTGEDSADYACAIPELEDKPLCSPIMRQQTMMILAIIRCYAVSTGAVTLFIVLFLLFWNAEKDYTKVYQSHWLVRKKQVKMIRKCLHRAEKYADIKLDVKEGRVVPVKVVPE